MLPPLSRKPQIIRLHQLQQTQRSRYCSQFCNMGQQLLPSNLWPILPLLSDIYYSYTTICLCRRRLGQEYTYVAMFNRRHYEEEGVLVNHKTRVLMVVLEILQRHLLRALLRRLWVGLEGKLERGGKWRIFRELFATGVDGVLAEGKLLMLMLFILGWNKHFNMVDTILKNEYIYTYFNKTTVKVDYRVEGYMLLMVFGVKLVRFFVRVFRGFNEKQRVRKSNDKKQEDKQQKVIQQEIEQEQQLCRICYDNIKNKSVTCCGHIFCWECILKYLVTHPECPVCRTACQPKQIIQLQNY